VELFYETRNIGLLKEWLEGPSGLRLIKGFRSSRLGKQWRVLHKVERDDLEVYVFDVNPHNY